MTVKELINELEQHDPEAEVFAYDPEYEGVNAVCDVNVDIDQYYVLTQKAGKPAAVIIY